MKLYIIHTELYANSRKTRLVCMIILIFVCKSNFAKLFRSLGTNSITSLVSVFCTLTPRTGNNLTFWLCEVCEKNFSDYFQTSCFSTLNYRLHASKTTLCAIITCKSTIPKTWLLCWRIQIFYVSTYYHIKNIFILIKIVLLSKY